MKAALSVSPEVNDFAISLIWLGAILLAGLLGSKLIKKTVILPGITGYILIGLLIGPSGLGLISVPMLSKINIFIDVCFGLILFELGKNFNLSWRTSDPWLFLGGILATTTSFLLMFATLLLMNFKSVPAALIAAITITSSPAVVFLIAKDLNFDGPVIRKAKGIVAINNVLGILIFVGILPFVHYKNQANWYTVILQPLYYLLGSIALSFVTYLATLIFAKLMGKDKMPQFIMLIAFLVITIALCYIFNLSIVISLLFYGIFIRNFNYKLLISNIDFGYIEDSFFLLLLVITAANLNFNNFKLYAVTVLVLLTVRFIGLLVPLYFLGQKSGFTKQQSLYLGCSIVPMAAMALWISKIMEVIYPFLEGQITQIVILSLLIMSLIGPSITQWAFKKAEQGNNSMHEG